VAAIIRCVPSVGPGMTCGEVERPMREASELNHHDSTQEQLVLFARDLGIRNGD
jgi:hypothetical protein